MKKAHPLFPALLVFGAVLGCRGGAETAAPPPAAAEPAAAEPAASEAAAADPAAAEPATPLSATPVWGSAVSFSPPVDLLFRLGAYTPAWKFRGAAGGASLDGAASGARSFAIDMSGNTGDNVAAGALRLDGRATFRATPDGALDAKWVMTPDRDGVLSEAMLETRIAIGRVAGGFLIDDKALPVPESVAAKPHLFRGEVSRLAALGADGVPWMEISFPERQRILVQDNRSWGSSVITLRLFFAERSVQAGAEYPVHAVFRFPGHRIALDETGPVVLEAGPDWIPYAPAAPGEDWIEPGSALDLSATLPRHEPAGAFGRVVAVGDHFELADRPGEEIRFCGVNLVHGANAPSVESADRLAANLARMGFNSVRIHHHERPILAKGDPAALAVDPEAQDRLDALCAACLRHGLYLTTDLYVSRAPIAWRAVGIDRPGNMTKDEFKMAALFHEGAYSNFLAWSRQFMLHVNPYTGRSLAQEPGLATLALVNEGNLGNYGRDALLAIPGVEEAWSAWCADHPELVAGRTGARAAADGSGAEPPPPPPLSRLPGDLYEAKGADKAFAGAFALFLADREAHFFRRVSAFVREELGCAAPLSNDSSWYNPDAYALLRAEFDYDDDHGYVDHPFFLGKSWQLPSSHPGANPLLGGDAVPGFAWRRLFGKPFCVTEWNWSAPGQFRQASGLVMGALAARQGWNGLWRFAWSHDRAGAENPGSVRMRYFDLSADPAQCASERATICGRGGAARRRRGRPSHGHSGKRPVRLGKAHRGGALRCGGGGGTSAGTPRARGGRRRFGGARSGARLVRGRHPAHRRGLRAGRRTFGRRGRVLRRRRAGRRMGLLRGRPSDPGLRAHPRLARHRREERRRALRRRRVPRVARLRHDPRARPPRLGVRPRRRRAGGVDRVAAFLRRPPHRARAVVLRRRLRDAFLRRPHGLRPRLRDALLRTRARRPTPRRSRSTFPSPLGNEQRSNHRNLRKGRW